MARALGVLAAAVLALPVSATAGSLSRHFPAPPEAVRVATETALEREGWGVDRVEPALGLIVTNSARRQGDAEGLWTKTKRLRLRILVRPEDGGTTVSVERELFLRERVFGLIHDEPIDTDPLDTSDDELLGRLLDAIGRAL